MTYYDVYIFMQLMYNYFTKQLAGVRQQEKENLT